MKINLDDGQRLILIEAMRNYIHTIEAFLADMDEGDDAPGPQGDLEETKALLAKLERG